MGASQVVVTGKVFFFLNLLGIEAAGPTVLEQGHETCSLPGVVGF